MGLKYLSVSDNPVGGDGLSVLARMPPSTIEPMIIKSIDCGSKGVVALAEALPLMTDLWEVHCDGNPARSEAGWVVLIAAAAQHVPPTVLFCPYPTDIARNT